MVRVKICGIRTERDAQVAASYGADAIGLLVGQAFPSPDFIATDLAARIVRVLPPFVTATLVTHHHEPDTVAALIADVHPAAVQIHSEMSPSSLAALKREFPGIRFLKSYHVVDAHSLDYGEAYLPAADAFVLDSQDAARGMVGGTGVTHDWNVSVQIVQRYRIPIVLAGGLTPANVQSAIALVKPFAVDVNSGVKGVDGRKDPTKVAEFIARAKSAE